MFCYNKHSCTFYLKISQIVLKKERELIENHRKIIFAKMDKGKDRREYHIYKEIQDECKQLMENIDVTNEEILCLNTLKDFVNFLESSNMRLVLKCKVLINENNWLETQVKDFEDKLTKLENDWAKLGAQRYYKRCFFKMRYLQSYLNFNDEIAGCDVISSDNSNAYEPDEFYSIDIKPFCKIVKEHMFECRNELAITWCNDILNFYKDKDGESSKNVSDMYSFIGRIYKLNKQYDKAQCFFEKAIKIQEMKKDNENEKGVNQTFLGIIYEKQKRYTDAEISFRKAIECRETIIGRFHPDISDLHCRLGSICNKIGNWKGSINNYSLVLPYLEHIYEELDPQILNSYITLGNSYTELRLEEKAYVYIEKYSKLILRKKSNDENIVSPFTALLQSVDKGTRSNKVFNLLSIYGPVNKCCTADLLSVLTKYFVIFNHNESLELLNGWCDMSNYPFEFVKYTHYTVPGNVEPKSASFAFHRTSRNDSFSSYKSDKLKKMKKFIKNPLRSVIKRSNQP